MATLNLRRFCNLAYVVLFELMPDPLWDEKGHRRQLVRALAWPDELDEQDAKDREAEAAGGVEAAKAHGIGVDEKQWGDAWEVYKAAVAARAAREAQRAAAADPPPEGEGS